VLLQIRVSNLAKKFYRSLRIELKCHKVEHADGWAQLAQSRCSIFARCSRVRSAP
jgi:hypothetical protein